jgi:hypothetical protein
MKMFFWDTDPKPRTTLKTTTDNEHYQGFGKTLLGMMLGLIIVGIVLGILCAIIWSIVKFNTMFILAIIFLSVAIIAELVKIITQEANKKIAHFWDHYDEDRADEKEGP